MKSESEVRAHRDCLTALLSRPANVELMTAKERFAHFVRRRMMARERAAMTWVLGESDDVFGEFVRAVAEQAGSE